MMMLEQFNDRYVQGTLTFEDMVWYLDYLMENYDPNRFYTLGLLHRSVIGDYLYFSERKDGEIEQMTCHIEAIGKDIRFKFDRYRYVGETKPHHYDDFNPIRIKVRSKGYKKFVEWWENFVEIYG